MYKLYTHASDKLKLLVDKVEVLSNFEIIESTDLSIEDLLSQQYEVIEFEVSEYDKFKSYVKTVDWKTNLTGIADCLILKNGTYRAHSILPEAILHILKKNSNRVNSLKPVIVIGDINFVMGVVTKLALSGFIEIIVSLTEDNEEIIRGFEQKIRSFVFNLNIKIIQIGELTSSELDAFILICDFKKEKNKEAYELLSYFNFLSENAIFIDCNSLKDGYLVDDAKKADIFVVDEVEVLENKYIKLLESLQNSP